MSRDKSAILVHFLHELHLDKKVLYDYQTFLRFHAGNRSRGRNGSGATVKQNILNQSKSYLTIFNTIIPDIRKMDTSNGEGIMPVFPRIPSS